MEKRKPVMLDAATHELLKEFSEESGLKIKHIVNEAIKKYIKEKGDK